MNTESIIAELLNVMQHAIDSGDWRVDGACDPDSAIEYAALTLRSRGWTQNSIDGSWMRPQ